MGQRLHDGPSAHQHAPSATPNTGQTSAALHSCCRLAALLRSIPAAESERWALNGLDPTHLAMLALKDARRGGDLNPKNPAFHRRKVYSR